MPFPFVRAILPIMLLLITAVPVRVAASASPHPLVWTQLGLANTSITALAVDPGDPAHLYAAGTDAGASDEHFFESRDGGATWSSRPVPAQLQYIFFLTVDRTGTLYGLTAERLSIAISTDHGTTWTLQPTHIPDPQHLIGFTRLIIHPRDPAIRLLVGSRVSFVSHDGGASWQSIPGIPCINDPAWGASGADELVLQPGAPDTIYAGGRCGISTSTDAGRTWHPLPKAPNWALSIAPSPFDPHTVFAGGYEAGTRGANEGLWVSHDGGTTWTRLAPVRPEPVIFDPHDAQIMYTLGAWSTDGGKTWSFIATPPSVTMSGGEQVMQVTANRILVGTTDGIWQMRYPSPSAIAPISFSSGYRIVHAAVWSYYQTHGGMATFGVPLSRLFAYRWSAVQIFQHGAIQIGPGGRVQVLNLLDDELRPLTTLSGTMIPAHDPVVATVAPLPSDPAYGEKAVTYLASSVPDTWEGVPVGFYRAYLHTAPAESGNLRPLLALEVAGFPTSRPMRDPQHPHVITQRFQKTVLRYDATTGRTELLAAGAAFRQLLTGALPQLQGSPYANQYCPDKPYGVCRRDVLPVTSLLFAFEPETGGSVP